MPCLRHGGKSWRWWPFNDELGRDLSCMPGGIVTGLTDSQLIARSRPRSLCDRSPVTSYSPKSRGRLAATSRLYFACAALQDASFMPSLLPYTVHTGHSQCCPNAKQLLARPQLGPSRRCLLICSSQHKRNAWGSPAAPPAAPPAPPSLQDGLGFLSDVGRRLQAGFQPRPPGFPAGAVLTAQCTLLSLDFCCTLLAPDQHMGSTTSCRLHCRPLGRHLQAPLVTAPCSFFRVPCNS